MLSDALGSEKVTESRDDIESFMINFWLMNSRPWNEFFAVFKPPQWNYGLIEQRISTNCLHYRSNYILLCVGIFAVRMVFSPLMLLNLMICAAGAIYLLKVMTVPLIIGHWTLKYRDKSLIILVLCILFLTFTSTLLRLIWTSLVAAIICGLHMFFGRYLLVGKWENHPNSF